MRKPITREEAENFFRFFYIATSGHEYYQTGGNSKWDLIDPQFREMRHEFFDGDLPYTSSDVRERELDISAPSTLNTGLISTTAYGEWVRAELHKIDNPDLV